MKKLLLALVLCLALAFPAYAENIKVMWDYDRDAVEMQGFRGWRLYMVVDQAGGPYQPFSDILYDGNPADSYEVQRVLSALMGTHTYYFVMTAIGRTDADEEVESEKSNEASVELTAGLPTPINLQAIIQVN